jgi:hypothetical protein
VSCRCRARAGGAAGLAGAVAAALIALLPGAPAAAGPDSETSALDPGDPYDVHVSLDYRVTSRRSTIEREASGAPGTDPDGPMPLVKDLVFSGTRHELVPRVEVGVYTDLAVTLALPLVVRDTRRLEFDQRADRCVFAASARDATCIDATNSTTVADGLVPGTGFDASHPGAGGAGGAAVFRGRSRAGLDQLHLGVVWAPLVQARDPSKPTWKTGAELRLSIGSVMAFDGDRPAGESGVSRGVHELRLYTSMARRIGRAEPTFELWWMGPIGTRSGAPLDDRGGGFAAEKTGAQQRVGGRFGVGVTAWQSRSRRQQVDVQLGGEIEALFAGRAYTDMWEVFAYAGHASDGGPLVIDADPAEPGLQAADHPGVSNVQDYLTLAGRLGVDAVVTDMVRVDAGLQLGWEQAHLISFADAGADGDDDDDAVDPGTDEVNPFHIPLIDDPGHRYRVEGAATLAASLGVRVLF